MRSSPDNLNHPHALEITGTSMKPFLQSGDYVLTENCLLSKAIPGDVVIANLANSEHRFCVHRLLWRTARLIMLKGDGISSFDCLRIGRDAEFSGRATYLLRNGQKITLKNNWANLFKLIISIYLIPWYLLRGR
ncbi:MAG: S24/S26 family peptidase [Candidatus Brocadiia bacterium]